MYVNTFNHDEMLHFFMLQLYISLGLIFSVMLQQNCDYGLGRLGIDHLKILVFVATKITGKGPNG